jgi:putative oxidoreductase
MAALLILLYVYTGMSKMLDHNLFTAQLQYYPLLAHLATIISFLLPITELLVAALLFFPKTRIAGLFASSALLIVFTLYLIFMLLFHGENLPCSCGGVLRHLSWKQHLVFNSLFLAANCVALRINRDPSKAFIAINRLVAENPDKKK